MRRWNRRWIVVLAFAGAVLLLVLQGSRNSTPVASPDPQGPQTAAAATVAEPRYVGVGQLTNWWDAVPDSVQEISLAEHRPSNIHPEDYAGPEACKDCHRKNYESWSHHPHRWMNAHADPATVRGDFSDTAEIAYLGGVARFRCEDGTYEMRLTRDGCTRTYEITQTIGSRFFQYYVGRLVDGPEPSEHAFYQRDFVLPFGYWLSEREWVPIVHVGGEFPDGERVDPFDPHIMQSPRAHEDYFPYAESCNRCHTTFPLADMMVREPELIGRHAPAPMSFLTSAYLAETHPHIWPPSRAPHDASTAELSDVFQAAKALDAREHAVTLGISCEACHLGSRAHADKEQKRPAFFPRSPYLFVEAEPADVQMGKSHDNVNWVCGRCHSGFRPQFAAGMSTWNSAEFKDASLGSCYSELRCVDCHNPHEAIGQKWNATPAEDDQKCLACHEQFGRSETLVAHTHHPVESAGSRCMNCHMPRINEGLQDVVRTHTIFSPTHRGMIESNHPNACNLCHTDQSMTWTVRKLADWYGAEFSETEIEKNSPDPTLPVGLQWLASDDPAVRLVAADALSRSDARWALPQLIDALDDRYLLNRQFARRGLEQMLGLRLAEFGYRFYMTPQERRAPIQRLKQQLLENTAE